MKLYARLVPIVLILLVVSAQAQSLGDLAKKEKERRDKVKAGAKVITNNDTGKYESGSVTTGTIPAPAADTREAASAKPGTDKGAPAAQASGPAPVEAVDLEGRTESFWRQTFADARGKLKELEIDEKVLILKLNDLQNRFYREDDGFKQGEIQRQINKTLYEQDLNKTNLAKAKADLTNLEKDARKSGALPGWLTATPAKNP